MASNRKALCVGINQFKNYSSSNLQGCVNDAHDMGALLKDFLGFTAADITTLTDAQATKANIMSSLKSMVADAKAGKYSYLVFSLSSHGTQMPDASGDEPDRADEAFCPYDLGQKGNQWDPARIILDDELRDLFIQLPPHVLLEVYLDTCHSGDGLRTMDLLLDRKPRFLPPPSLEAFKKVEGRRTRGVGKSVLDRSLTHHILWAGCRANQTSADARIGGAYHGAFTYYFCKELRGCKNSLSRAALLKKIRADLKGNFTQIPQLESSATTRNKKIG